MTTQIERRLDATLSRSERLQARCDAWQVLQMLQLRPNTRDTAPDETRRPGGGSEVA